MKKEFYYKSADGRTEIHAVRWEPECEPVGVVQIIHGMMEYIDRYEHFAEYLRTHGFVVTGEDHLGHGRSVAGVEDYGYFGSDGNNWMISDIHRLRTETQAMYSGVPYYILGHSMGSFLLRQYVTENNCKPADGLAGIVIMGTGWMPKASLKAGKILAKSYGLDKKKIRCKLLETIAFGSYLKKIDNPVSISDWLTKDSEIVKAYRNDPMSTFHFTANGYYHMFAGMEKAHNIKRMEKLPAGFPVLFVSGEEDPVGGWGKSVRKAAQTYSQNTRCKISTIFYPGDRHEILNETDKDKVYCDLLKFFKEY